ncbi:MAG: PAS domain S-box protein, partial [Bacteroidales bacterium]|nr:PAS domain S-box protein [Bacteroidales bacterium]
EEFICKWDIEMQEQTKSILSELNSREILNASNDAIFILNMKSGEVIDYNDVALEVFEYPDRKSMKPNLYSFFDKENKDNIKQIEESYQNATKNNSLVNEATSRKFDGSLFFTSVLFKKITISKKPYILAIISDITEKRNAEQLANYRFKLEKLIYDISARFINIASYEVDSFIEKSFEEICQFTNSSAAYIYSYRDLRGEVELTHYWHNNSSKVFPKNSRIVSMESLATHYYIMYKDKLLKVKSIKDVVDKESPLFKSFEKIGFKSFIHIALLYQSNVIGFLGISATQENRFWNDDEVRLLQMLGEIYVSALQRKEAIKVLLEGERTYREIYNATNDAIMVIDFDDYSIVDINSAFTEMFGFGYDEFSDKTFANLSSPNQTGKNINPHTYVKKSKTKTQVFEWFARKKNNEDFWAEVSIKNAEVHGIERALAVVRDVSERKKAEQALRESEDRFRSIVQQLTDMVVIINPHGEIEFVTPSVNKILGFTQEEVLQHKFNDFIFKEDIPIFTKLQQEILENNHDNLIELRVIKKNSEIVTLEMGGNDMTHHPAIRGVVVTCRDITERKNMESRILDAVIKTEEKERERFAKNLHDDLGPLLSSIKMYLGMLAKLEEKDKRDYVNNQLNDIVKEAILTTKDVSNDLSPHVLTNYGLSSAVESFISKLSARIDFKFENEIEGIRYDPRIETSLYRIVKELINNTLKHSESTKINIKLKEKGLKLILKYIDNGKGINQKELDEYIKKGMGISNII